MEVPRESKYDMISVAEATRCVLVHCSPVESELVSLENALGRVVAKDVRAPLPFPPFRASVMDGYAFIAADGAGVFDVVSSVTAGSSSFSCQSIDENFRSDDSSSDSELKSGQVVYITTGAAVPKGADAVIKVEWTERVPDQPRRVRLLKSVEPGTWIRPIGCDLQQDEVILKAGEVLHAAEIGLMATCGIQLVDVVRRVRVGVLSTGDELVDVNDCSISAPGANNKIRDSNRPMLLAAAREAGAEAIDLGIVADKQIDLERVFTRVLCRDDFDTALSNQPINSIDILITSGGVSMGSLDLVKPLLERMGTVHFGRLNMKPGKPTTFATVPASSPESTPAACTSLNRVSRRDKLVFALPGNPASALTTFQLLVVPALNALAGRRASVAAALQARCNLVHFDLYSSSASSIASLTLSSLSPLVPVRLGQRWPLDSERPEYHRATLEYDFNSNQLVAVSTGSQASSRLLSMKSAACLVEIPSGQGFLPSGTVIPARLIASSLNTLNIEPHNPEKHLADPPSACCHHNCGDNQHSSTPTSHSSTLAASSASASLRVAMLTVSDRVSRGEAEDKSGPTGVALCQSHGWTLQNRAVVPDEIATIQAQILSWSDAVDVAARPHLILTSGGTGFAPRDVTPEAVSPLLHKCASGVVHVMMSVSLTKTPTALLARPVAGIRNQSLIICMPGSPKAVQEILEALLPVLPHGVKLMTSEPTEH